MWTATQQYETCTRHMNVTVGWMDGNRRRHRCAIAVAIVALSQFTAAALQRPSADGLKILTIEGEDAVNVIQQKTAVSPIVEVRDRNDQPVGGVVVTFVVNGGRATFGGAQTLTLTTNAAGRAMAAGLTPTATGSVQITASAAFQGQTAIAAITQTNVLTAAEAVAAAGAGGSGAGGATAGAGAGGGGLSGTTIGILGAAAAGGAVAGVVSATGSEPQPTPISYTGSYAGETRISFVNVTNPFTCVTTRGLAGTLSVTLVVQTDGTVTGTATTTVSSTTLVTTCPPPGQAIGVVARRTWDLAVTGPTRSLAFTGQQTVTGPNDVGGTATQTDTLTFAGEALGGVISGRLAISLIGSAINPNGTSQGASIEFSGSATIAVTLR
jgi:hypothetical protein